MTVLIVSVWLAAEKGTVNQDNKLQEEQIIKINFIRMMHHQTQEEEYSNDGISYHFFAKNQPNNKKQH